MKDDLPSKIRHFRELATIMTPKFPELRPRKITRPDGHRRNRCSNPREHPADAERRCLWESSSKLRERRRKFFAARWNISVESYSAYDDPRRCLARKGHEQFFADQRKYRGVDEMKYFNETPSGYARRRNVFDD